MMNQTENRETAASTTMEATAISTRDTTTAIPRQSYKQLFLRFLRFGFLAWGGPVAQIAMIRQELVEEERWIAKERFNRALAVYQVLPGPEAHELCVYFGMLARGRLGGFLAGLGFMLPGLLLMLLLSWFYVTFGITSPLFAAALAGVQPAVAALIVRAIHRIGQHALINRWAWGVALLVALAEFLRVAPFWVTLLVGASIYSLAQRDKRGIAVGLSAVFLAVIGLVALSGNGATLAPQGAATQAATSAAPPSPQGIFVSGLRAGLLTFGGAYTAIPFLRNDAVVQGGWLTDAQFLDSLALSGILPAPLIIFATFLGYVGGGLSGGLLMTTGVFLPAFSFTLVGHDLLERLIHNQKVHAFLDGVTAGVVGLIAVTALALFRSAIPTVPALAIFLAALLVLYQWKAKTAVAAVVIGAGLLGLLLFSKVQL